MVKEKLQEGVPDTKTLRLVKGDYKAMYEAAKKTGKLQRPTYRIHTWSEDSAMIIGRVVDISTFVGGKFEAEVNCYRIRTDDGVVSCILGTYTDGQLAEVGLLNRVACIQYQGQKSLDDGRKVNVFDVDILDESEVRDDADK